MANTKKLLSVLQYAKLRGVAFSTVYDRLAVGDQKPSDDKDPKGLIAVVLDENNKWKIDPEANKHIEFVHYNPRKKSLSAI